MIDLLGHEYGYSPDQVLRDLTGRQICALIEAIDARYTAQHDAMDSHRPTPSGGGDPLGSFVRGMPANEFPEKPSDSLIREWGIQTE